MYVCVCVYECIYAYMQTQDFAASSPFRKVMTVILNLKGAGIGLCTLAGEALPTVEELGDWLH